MENNTLHKLGIDIGSTTVKVAVLDEHDNLLFSDYERHFANIRGNAFFSDPESIRSAR